MLKMGKSANYDVANFKQSLNDGFNYLELFGTMDTAPYYSTSFLLFPHSFSYKKGIKEF